MLGAFSVAGEKPFALKAFGGELVPLVDAEGGLLVRAHHLGDRLFGDVAEEIILIDKMVARVEVAVVLDDGIAAAGLGEGAGAGHLPDPSGQSGVEISDEYAADIIPDPIIEYVAEEPAVAHIAHRPRGDHRSVRFRVHDERTLLLVRLPGPVQRVLDVLDHRHKLHKSAADLTQKQIRLQPSAFTGVVDRGHSVELNSFPFQNIQSVHHPVEGREPALVLAVLVMNIIGAVQGYSHKEIVLAEEPRPFPVEERAVGLDGVVDDLFTGIFLLKFQSLAVEIQPQHQRFAAVPVEGHFRHTVRADIFLNHFFEHRFGHPGLLAAVDLGLVEVVAIFAVQIAERPGGLDHDVERHRSGKADGVPEGQCLFKCRV